MVRQNPNNGGRDRFSSGDAAEPPGSFVEDIDSDSACSSPYVSAPSSPAGNSSSRFYSAPTSPMTLMLSPARKRSGEISCASDSPVSGSSEFEFASKFSPVGAAAAGSMSSADELFHNGKIRPTTSLSFNSQSPQVLAPMLDLEVEDEDEERNLWKEEEEFGMYSTRGRDLDSWNGSTHRNARSLSPLGSSELDYWREEDDNGCLPDAIGERVSETVGDHSETASPETTPYRSASSSSSSSSWSSSSSRKWTFFKGLLYRSKSEGSADTKNKSRRSKAAFSPAREKGKQQPPRFLSQSTSLPIGDQVRERPPRSPDVSKENRRRKRVVSYGGGGVKLRPPPSPHERHYTCKRAEAEEMKKKTSLPYRQGLFGCMGLSSKSYGAIHGIAHALKSAVSSR